VYGHPDHIAVSQFTRQATVKPIQLLWATISPHYVLPSRKNTWQNAKYPPYSPGYKTELATSDIVAKLKSFRAHASQFPLSLKKTPSDLSFFSCKPNPYKMNFMRLEN